MAELGRSVPDYSKVVSASPADEDIEHKVDYPDIRIQDAPESLWDIPEEGTAKVHYKITRKEINNEEKSCHLTLDLHTFEPEEKEKKKPSRIESIKDSMDAYNRASRK